MALSRTVGDTDTRGRRGQGAVANDDRDRWVALVAALFVTILVGGCYGGMGVLLVELKDVFDVRLSTLASVGGIQTSSGFLLGIFIGFLIKKFGCRRVGLFGTLLGTASLLISGLGQDFTTFYIFYGFGMGISTGCLFNIGLITVQENFHRRRALAAGIQVSGMCWGYLTFSPLTRWLADLYGWQGALLVLAGIHLNGLVFCLLIPTPVNPKTHLVVSVIHQANDKNMELSDSPTCRTSAAGLLLQRALRSVLKCIIIHPHFALFVLAVACHQSGNIMIYTLTPSLAEAKGLSRSLGPLLVSVTSGMGGVARMCCGYLGDWRSVHPVVMCGLAGIVAGVLLPLLTLPATFLPMILLAALLGLPSAAFMSAVGTATVRIVGTKYLEQGIGLMSFAFGLANLVCFLLTGRIEDMFGDVTYGFVTFGLVQVAGGGVFMMTYILHRRGERNRKPPPPEMDRSNIIKLDHEKG